MKLVKHIMVACLAVFVWGTTAWAAIVVQEGEDDQKSIKPPVAVPPPAAAESNRTDTIEFLNGDVLHGDFISIDPKTGARFRHPAVKDPIDVDLSSISRIKLEHSTARGTNTNQTCSVKLTNKDQLLGELVGMDSTNLHLNTWYAGTLLVPRKMVQLIVPGQAKGGIIYEGPTGMEGWTAQGGAMIVRPGGVITRGVPPWSYSDKAFISTGNGSIGHAFELPPMANIEFDLSWNGYLQMFISFCSDTLQYYGGNAYTLVLSQGSVYLQRISRTGDSSMLGNVEAPALARKNQAHISLRINRQQKTIALLVNGALVRQWTDTANTFMNGPNLVFHQQGQSRTKISGIKITTWDGKLDLAGDASRTKEDLVKLANNDKISGTLKSIQNGKMQFQTAFAALEVPLERISQIELASENAEHPPQHPDEVRLNFVDQGSVTFRLEHWDAQQITGTSPAFGEVKLNPSAFGEIHLNIDQKRTESDDSAMGGVAPEDIILDKE